MIQAPYQQAALPAETIDSVLMGCVLPERTDQASARQAALHAGLPQSTHAVTINKVCGSGMQAVFFTHDTLLAGRHDMVIAGGMENMTRALTCRTRPAKDIASGMARVSTIYLQTDWKALLNTH